MKHTLHALALAAATLACSLAQADTGKLLLTGGVSSVDGAAGGGLTPWAVIGSNATDGEIGGQRPHLAPLSTQDYGLTAYRRGPRLQGTGSSCRSRSRTSMPRQPSHSTASPPFGVTPGQHIKMDVLGVKFKVAGDAVLDSDTLMPQIAVGLEHKRASPGSIQSVYNFLGVQNSGTDLYVSATKLFLAQGILVNGTLRATKANQNGLLGFGSAAGGRNSYSLQPEFSVAYLLRKDLAIGVEYRFKPNNLESLGRAAGLGDALREDDWKDIFIAWAPNKHLSLTLAYVDLGRVVPGITGNRKQRGAYLSAQVAF
jgi:hypothetical protein